MQRAWTIPLAAEQHGSVCHVIVLLPGSQRSSDEVMVTHLLPAPFIGIGLPVTSIREFDIMECRRSSAYTV